MNHSRELLQYTLQIADNALILGHRLSEWCGHGPVLEQDIAITNTALDHLGAARSLYQYAAEQFNSLSDTEKQDVFVSPLIQQVSGPADEDDLAFLRDAWDYRNVLLAEQPNGDWAHTVARSFFFDAFNTGFFTALKESRDQTLAAVAEKYGKEIAYHLRWSSEWIIRLGDGTEESHRRMQQAVDDLWMFTGELFRPSDADRAMAAEGIGVMPETLKEAFDKRLQQVFEEAGIAIPRSSWMQEGGKEGNHSEHLGYILAEMQFLQRAYPNMEW